MNFCNIPLNDMKTGIKTLIKKAIDKTKYPFDLQSEENTFPKKSNGYLKMRLFSYTIRSQIKNLKLNKTLGILHAKPDKDSINIWRKLIKFNKNSLGFWSDKNKLNLNGSEICEHLLINKLINLYGASPKKWVGYVTSGATEANIFSLWIGRNLLKEKFKAKKICLIVNGLAHYSILKGANLIDVEVFVTPIDRKHWNTNVNLLEKEILKLKKTGYSGFLIPITLGYTQTGTNDNLKPILRLIQTLEKKYKIHCYLWIDAATNGLVLPFSKNDFKPLQNNKLSSLVLDFHKTGMNPIPSGVVIFRSNLKKYISRKVSYIEGGDSTLLGSRSGIPAVSMLSVINKYGKEGFTNITKNSIHKKLKFKKKVMKLFPNIEIVDQTGGISLGLIARKRLPQWFTYKYGIYANRWKYSFDTGNEYLYIYKVTFTPDP